MTGTADLMTRRQALARAAYILGGALSAPTIAGVLAGCGAPLEAAEGAAWIPRTLSVAESQMVLIMGEHIIPETDTPGARAARVDRYIDDMLTDYYSEEHRKRFITGLQRADARARRAFGKGFLELSPEQQEQVSRALNRAAFEERRQQSEVRPEDQAQPRNPVVLENDVQRGNNQQVLPVLDDDWTEADLGRNAFFRNLKELVLVGYYTSEAGATQELRVNPMGVWRPDISYDEIGHGWA